MSKQVLVTLSDKNYAPQVKQMLSSVYHNAGWTGDYLLLDHGIREKDARWFEDKGILVKHVDPLYEKEFEYFPVTVLSKFYLFTKAFKRWDRVLFLDGDIIVDASLDGLTRPSGFVAVHDIQDRTVGGQFFKSKRSGSDPEHRRKWGEIAGRYDLEKPSFNVGVMSFDTGAIPQGAFEDLNDLFREYGLMTLFNEQAIMNLYFQGKWRPMPVAYNNYYLYTRRPFSLGFVKCPAIANHFIIDKLWNTKNPDYYPTWKRNLRLAEAIDLDDRPPPAKVWTNAEIARVSAELEGYNCLKNRMAMGIGGVGNTLDRQAGRFGLWLKRTSPGLYGSVRRR